jgi:hypothetical protein
MVNNTKWKKQIYNHLDPRNALNELGHLLPFLSTYFLNDPTPSPEDDALAATVKGSCICSISQITLGLLPQPPDTFRTGHATSRFTSACRIDHIIQRISNPATSLCMVDTGWAMSLLTAAMLGSWWVSLCTQVLLPVWTWVAVQLSWGCEHHDRPSAKKKKHQDDQYHWAGDT